LPNERFAAVRTPGRGNRVRGGMCLPVGMPVLALSPAPHYVDRHEHGDYYHQEQEKSFYQHATHILSKPTARLMSPMR
jgi:hypothetical protein